MGYKDHPEYFPASQPRRVSDGIRAQNKRGAFASRWWAKRWIETLESFNIGARLERGRRYARQGQVLDIQIAAGQVTAQVQGSERRPYRVSIGLKPLSPANWRKLSEAMVQEARFSAKLLAGEMPEDIEALFTAEGLSLFPRKRGDLVTQCSCPDASNPCKHIAAVYYLLGEAFDHDPFLMFRLRGMERDELLAQLGQNMDEEKLEAASEPESLPEDPATFWAMPPLPENQTAALIAPSQPAVLLRRLGPFPFWRGTVSPLEGLEPVYAAMAACALGLMRQNE